MNKTLLIPFNVAAAGLLALTACDRNAGDAEDGETDLSDPTDVPSLSSPAPAGDITDPTPMGGGSPGALDLGSPSPGGMGTMDQ